MLRLLKYFYRPYVSLLIGLCISGIFFVVCEALSVAAIFPIVSLLTRANSLESGSHIIKLVQKIAYAIPIQDKFIAVFLLFLTIHILVNLSRYIYESLTLISSYVIMCDFQKKVYKKILHSDYQYFLDNKQGELMYRINTAPGQMTRAFTVIPRFIVEFLKTLIIVFVLFTISWRTASLLLFIGVILSFPNRWIARKISYSIGKKAVKKTAEQIVLSSESISGIRQLKAFLRENIWIKQFFKANQDFLRVSIKENLFIPLPSSVLEVFGILIICIGSIIIKMRLGNSFDQFLPVIGVYLYAFMRIVPGISSFSQMYMQFMGGLPYAEVVYNELHTKSHWIDDGIKILNSFANSICFDHILFTYPKRERTLNNINITFEKGKVTAIVGPSGSGKSTIIDLILRFYKPTDGKIFIDGIDLSELKISSWLDKIGFVSQDTFIFNASIADNISFSFDEFKPDLGKNIETAAKVANAHDFISALPEGYNTIIGDRGLKLSGGERQRVAIARAIYKKPEILIFDEATSSLDSKAEKIVQNAIDIISQNHTVIVIAHRLSTVVNADKIIVIDNGTIVEEGNHDTLMEKEGLYWRMYNEQNLLAKGTAGNIKNYKM